MTGEVERLEREGKIKRDKRKCGGGKMKKKRKDQSD